MSITLYKNNIVSLVELVDTSVKLMLFHVMNENLSIWPFCLCDCATGNHQVKDLTSASLGIQKNRGICWPRAFTQLWSHFEISWSYRLYSTSSQILSLVDCAQQTDYFHQCYTYFGVCWIVHTYSVFLSSWKYVLMADSVALSLLGFTTLIYGHLDTKFSRIQEDEFYLIDEK